MRERTSVLIGSVLAAAFLAMASSGAYAQANYPNRPIKMIVPVPPGTLLDALPRMIGEKLQAKWGQPVIVENRPGAASNLGTEAVYKSEPDGHTLLVTPPGPLAVSQHVYARLGFDPMQFVPVTVLVKFPFFTIVNPKVPATNLRELVAHAKANPDKVTFASPGVSSTPHLTMEKLARAAGIKLVHVPYQGLAPALNDLLGGHVDAMFDTPANSQSHIGAGRVKLLAVTGDKRLPELSNVATISESYPGVSHEDWFAVVAPPKTPPEIAAKLSEAIVETLKMPDIAKRITDNNFMAIGASPAETAALIRSESEKFRQVIVAAGIKVE